MSLSEVMLCISYTELVLCSERGAWHVSLAAWAYCQSSIFFIVRVVWTEVRDILSYFFIGFCGLAAESSIRRGAKTAENSREGQRNGRSMPH